MRRFRAIALGCVLVVCASSSTHARESAWQHEEGVSFRILAAETAVHRAIHALRFALLVSIEPGWKFFWTAPGALGVPSILETAASENLTRITVSWPTPKRLALGAGTAIGYEDSVLVPMVAYAEVPSRPVVLRVSLAYGVCAEVCIPGSVSLALSLPEGHQRASVHARAIGRVIAADPPSLGTVPVFIAGDTVLVALPRARTWRAPDVFIDLGPAFTVGPITIDRMERGIRWLGATFVAAPDTQVQTPASAAIVFVERGRAYRATGTIRERVLPQSR